MRTLRPRAFVGAADGDPPAGEIDVRLEESAQLALAQPGEDRSRKERPLLRREADIDSNLRLEWPEDSRRRLPCQSAIGFDGEFAQAPHDLHESLAREGTKAPLQRVNTDADQPGSEVEVPAPIQ
ncbi:MAG TPA: hypothetical protein VGH20_14630 [Myxococcales bacterium]